LSDRSTGARALRGRRCGRRRLGAGHAGAAGRARRGARRPRPGRPPCRPGAAATRWQGSPDCSL